MATIDVETTAGTVRGQLTDGAAAFKGVPYAEPPFGPHLFKPPARTPWKGVRECTDYGPRCPQPPFALFTDLGTGEDCLPVNVWMPEGAAELPVLWAIRASGSTPSTAQPAVWSWRAAMPVSQPTSSTSGPGLPATIRATNAGGYPGCSIHGGW